MKNMESELDIGFISDSSLYKKKFLLNKSISCDWIVRVPESIKAAKTLASLNHKEVSWIKVDQDYKYAVHSVTYGGINQRWLVVNNRESRHKELAGFDKRLKAEEESIAKKVKAVMSKTFTSQSEAHFNANRIIKTHPYFEFTKTVLGRIKKGKGIRPKSAKGFKVHLTFNINAEVTEKIRNSKGKFIVATNVLDNAVLSENHILELYRSRTPNMEGCFKLLKDPSLKLNQIFLKRVDRIQALLAVMTLCLFINRLGQTELKKNLAEVKQSIPNQNGIAILNPTLKWVFQLMSKIVKIKVQFSERLYEQYQGIGEVQTKIINCFGEHARAIYGFT